jgi:hypothetical protein
LGRYCVGTLPALGLCSADQAKVKMPWLWAGSEVPIGSFSASSTK